MYILLTVESNALNSDLSHDCQLVLLVMVLLTLITHSHIGDHCNAALQLQQWIWYLCFIYHDLGFADSYSHTDKHCNIVLNITKAMLHPEHLNYVKPGGLLMTNKTDSITYFNIFPCQLQLFKLEDKVIQGMIEAFWLQHIVKHFLKMQHSTYYMQ